MGMTNHYHGVFQDLILTELLSDQKDWIVGYHEHDSLLENRPDQDLNEDERQAAWDDYEKVRHANIYL